MNKKGAIQNWDLWIEVNSLMSNRTAGSVRLVKVKGHVSAKDVNNGLVALVDKIGNDHADSLAVAGSYATSADAGSRDAFRAKVLAATAVQRMMLDIFTARSQRKRQVAEQQEVSTVSSESSVLSISSASSDTVTSA
eukprot:8404579-Karenia_brevis.AAC.1